ncbi:MAG: mannitol dehydrogenase family protein [Planctomycetota bacterium]|jgi:mannitol-1-phosphate 5-dehydrogenase
MASHVFTGFGFGPIQAGLFINEAFQSSNFSRIAVAEIDRKLINAVRANNGSFYVNVARKDGIEILRIDNIEILNPDVSGDRKILLEALSESTEITTSLPSVEFFDTAGASVASLIAKGLKNSTAEAVVIYTAENNNNAAQILEKTVAKKADSPLAGRVQFLNTVIGKMSRVLTDSSEISRMNLKPITPGFDRAFLVEEFNRILVTNNRIPGFKPGIEVFVEKDDLLVFEEAKLYGHNAIHALLAYLGAMKGCITISELKDVPAIMAIARDAFLTESGGALVKKYAHFGDELFTEAGYKHYAEDLLERMTNPFLSDTIKRAGRDPVRKLRYNDRIFGTMTLALEQGIEPVNMALGAMAGIDYLLERAEENKLPDELCFKNRRKLSDADIEKILRWLWPEAGPYAGRITESVCQARRHLKALLEARG